MTAGFLLGPALESKFHHVSNDEQSARLLPDNGQQAIINYRQSGHLKARQEFLCFSRLASWPVGLLANRQVGQLSSRAAEKSSSRAVERSALARGQDTPEAYGC